MSDDDPGAVDGVKLTPWDRRVISAMNVAEGARRGVLILRVVAAVVALFAIVGGALSQFADVTSDGSTFEQTVQRATVGTYLSSIAGQLAFAGIVLALSYLVQIAAWRLDIDIVLSDAEETDDPDQG